MSPTGPRRLHSTSRYEHRRDDRWPILSSLGLQASVFWPPNPPRRFFTIPVIERTNFAWSLHRQCSTLIHRLLIYGARQPPPSPSKREVSQASPSARSPSNRGKDKVTYHVHLPPSPPARTAKSLRKSLACLPFPKGVRPYVNFPHVWPWLGWIG